MPFITTHVNTAVSEAQKEALTTGYRGICNKVLGKGEEWVMTSCEASATMSFRGSDAPCAFISVKNYGPFVSATAEKMTNEITALVSKTLGIPGDRIYIAYSEFAFWGYNGHNF